VNCRSSQLDLLAGDLGVAGSHPGILGCRSGVEGRETGDNDIPSAVLDRGYDALERAGRYMNAIASHVDGIPGKAPFSLLLESDRGIPMMGLAAEIGGGHWSERTRKPNSGS
jgi:hypothetical protein